MKNPIQPLVEDSQGVLRFKSNVIVEAMLDHCQKTGFDLNEIARRFCGEEHREDMIQLAQLIGYSLSGFGDLSYVDDDTYRAVGEMHTLGVSELEARLNTVQEELDSLRESLRVPIARLYGRHPDDLRR